MADAKHKWVMGLRPGNVEAFFARRDPTDAVRRERAHWLDEDPEKYAALTDAAHSPLRETVELAQTLGVSINPALPPWAQLLELGRGWEADFAWMHPDDKGDHRLIGGVVCFPSSWALRDKLQRTMSETHHPVPGLNAELDSKIETFFARMSPGVAWLRENAGYSRVPDLNQHPDRPRPPLGKTVVVDEFWIRLEHQLLLKLPISRSILFAIRMEVVPLRRVLESPATAAGLARLLETMPYAPAEYKGLTDAREAIILLLRAAESDTATDPPDDWK
ncbi:MAG: DUF3445 domain-containing protein [Pirellulales bacterium]|nr:DUF3445 domain-containing protein [Pirellulales bacterium]